MSTIHVLDGGYRMQKITYFHLAHCPYCIKANKAIDELIKENTAYGELEIVRIDEGRHPDIADRYDYYYVPTMYVGGKKQYEADPSQDYDAIKADVRRVFELAILPAEEGGNR